MTPKWYQVARSRIGVREVPGPQSNPVILGWAKKLGGWVAGWFKDDDIPWCAVFVNSCLQEAGVVGAKGGQAVAALDFASWGRTGPLTPGAILVFRRPGGHHVGFYVGERVDGFLRVLGGNQSNSVNETWIARERLIAVRWPLSEPLATEGRVMLYADGSPISMNEA